MTMNVSCRLVFLKEGEKVQDLLDPGVPGMRLETDEEFSERLKSKSVQDVVEEKREKEAEELKRLRVEVEEERREAFQFSEALVGMQLNRDKLCLRVTAWENFGRWLRRESGLSIDVHSRLNSLVPS